MYHGAETAAGTHRRPPPAAQAPMFRTPVSNTPWSVVVGIFFLLFFLAHRPGVSVPPPRSPGRPQTSITTRLSLSHAGLPASELRVSGVWGSSLDAHARGKVD